MQKANSAIFYLCLAGIFLAIGTYLWPVKRSGLTVICQNDGSYGYINSDGRVVIEPVWKWAGNFDVKGYAPVLSEDEKWGWINDHGEVIIKPTWEIDIDTFKPPKFNDFDMAMVSKTTESGVRNYGWIDRNGNEVINVNYLEVISSFDRDGVAVVRDKNGDILWLNKNGVTIYLADRHLEAFLQFWFSSPEWILVQNRFGWGVVDLDGNTILPQKWDAIGEVDDYDIARIKSEGLWGLVNGDGDEISPVKWHEIGEFDERGMTAVRRGRLWGWIDLEGTVTEPIWDEVKSFDPVNDVALVRKGENWGWVDRAGNVIVSPKWAEVGEFDSRGWLRAEKNGLHGWTNKLGEIVIPHQWEFAQDFSPENLAMVRNEGKVGWINREGVIAIPCQFDSTDGFDSKGMARVTRDNKWGWIDTHGDLIIPLEWDSAGEFDKIGMARVAKAGKTGWIGRDGTILISAEWDSCSEFYPSGLALVSKNGRWGWINRFGDIVVPVEWDADVASQFDFVEQDQTEVDTRYFGITTMKRYGKVFYVNSIEESFGPLEGYNSHYSVGKLHYFRFNFALNKGVTLNLEDSTFFGTHGLLSPYDEFKRAVVYGVTNPDSVGTGGFALSIIDGDGNCVIGPFENGWVPASTDYRRWSLPFNGAALGEVRISGPLYALRKKVNVTGFKKWWAKTTDRIIGDNSSFTGTEVICNVYDVNGDLVWSSSWITFETKCLLVTATLAFVLVFSMRLRCCSRNNIIMQTRNLSE